MDGEMSVNHPWLPPWQSQYLNKNFLKILPDISYESEVTSVEAKLKKVYLPPEASYSHYPALNL